MEKEKSSWLVRVTVLRNANDPNVGIIGIAHPAPEKTLSATCVCLHGTLLVYGVKEQTTRSSGIEDTLLVHVDFD